ncbi:MAG: nitroreductase [Nitratireductor sp.]
MAEQKDHVMKVSEAVDRRLSVRAYQDKPVETAVILDVLQRAARAPSGGNLQPWRVAVLNGKRMEEFRAMMESRIAGGDPRKGGDSAEYRVYPSDLKEPYRSSRFKVGEDMYALLGIAREDRAARLKWFANNFRFFGAPSAIFCFVDRQMGPPQWSDLGMFLQTFMLLLQEEGLDSCAQECWSMYPQTVQEFCAMPEDLMLFCGIAIGYRDETAPVNALRSEREPLETWVKVV